MSGPCYKRSLQRTLNSYNFFDFLFYRCILPGVREKDEENQRQISGQQYQRRRIRGREYIPRVFYGSQQ